MVVSFIFTTVCSQIINKGTKKAGFCDCVRRRYAHVSSCCFGSTKHINSLDKESANLQWESAGERAKWLCLNRIFRENFSSFAQFLRHRHRHRCCRRRRHSHCPQEKKIEFGRLHDSTVSCALSAQNTAHPWERHNRTLYKKNAQAHAMHTLLTNNNRPASCPITYWTQRRTSTSTLNITSQQFHFDCCFFHFVIFLSHS